MFLYAVLLVEGIISTALFIWISVACHRAVPVVKDNTLIYNKLSDKDQMISVVLIAVAICILSVSDMLYSVINIYMTKKRPEDTVTTLSNFALLIFLIVLTLVLIAISSWLGHVTSQSTLTDAKLFAMSVTLIVLGLIFIIMSVLICMFNHKSSRPLLNYCIYVRVLSLAACGFGAMLLAIMAACFTGTVL